MGLVCMLVDRHLVLVLLRDMGYIFFFVINSSVTESTPDTQGVLV